MNKNVMVKQSAGYVDNDFHVSYSKSYDKTVFLEKPFEWSGAHLAGLYTPYAPDTEQWTIVSNPEGAKICIPDGCSGVTNSTIPIPKSLNQFVILVMTRVSAMRAGGLSEKPDEFGLSKSDLQFEKASIEEEKRAVTSLKADFDLAVLDG